MAAQFGFGVQQGDLAGFLDRLGREFAESAVQVGDAAAEVLEEAIVASIRSNLNRDPTGAMERSVTRRVLADEEGRVIIKVGPTVPYAEIHDRGGTIEPHGDKLAIPLSFGPAPRGTWPRDVPDLFALNIPGKPNPFLVRRSGPGQLEFWFVLVDQVDIPARGYLQEAMAKADEPARVAILKELGRVLDAAGRPR